MRRPFLFSKALWHTMRRPSGHSSEDFLPFYETTIRPSMERPYGLYKKIFKYSMWRLLAFSGKTFWSYIRSFHENTQYSLRRLFGFPCKCNLLWIFKYSLFIRKLSGAVEIMERVSVFLWDDLNFTL